MRLGEESDWTIANACASASAYEGIKNGGVGLLSSLGIHDILEALVVLTELQS